MLNAKASTACPVDRAPQQPVGDVHVGRPERGRHRDREVEVVEELRRARNRGNCSPGVPHVQPDVVHRESDRQHRPAEHHRRHRQASAAPPAPTRWIPAGRNCGSTAAATSATAANTTASSGPSLPPRRIAAHSEGEPRRPGCRSDRRAQHLGRSPGEGAHRGQHVDQAPHVEEQQPAQRGRGPPGPTPSGRRAGTPRRTGCPAAARSRSRPGSAGSPAPSHAAARADPTAAPPGAASASSTLSPRPRPARSHTGGPFPIL